LSRQEGAMASSGLDALHEEHLRRSLPEHRLMVFVRQGNEEPRLWYQAGTATASGLSEEMASLAAAWHWQRPIASATLAAGFEDWRHALLFPCPLANLMEFRRREDIQLFTSREALRGFYYGYGTTPHGTHYLVVALLEVPDLARSQGFRILTRGWNQSGSGLALLPLRGGRDQVSPLFRRSPLLRRGLRRLRDGGFRQPTLVLKNGWVLLSERVFSPMGFRTVLAYRLPPTPRAWRLARTGLPVFLFAMSALAVLMWVEKTVFARGPRFGISGILLTVFLFTTALPVAGIWVFSRRALQDEDRRLRREMARSLGEDIDRLDSGLLLHHAALVQSFFSLRRDQDIARALVREEEAAAAARAEGEFLGGITDSPTMKALAVRLQFDQPLTEARSAFFTNFLAAVGLGPFKAAWAQNIAGSGNTRGNTLIEVAEPLSRRFLRQYAPSRLEEAADSARQTVDGVKAETVIDILRSYLPPQMTVNMGFYPEETGEFRVTAGRSHFLAIPVYLGESIRFALFLIWNTMLLDKPYLQTVLLGNPGAAPHPLFRGLYAVPVGFGRETIPPDLASHPHLSTLLDRVAQTRSPVRMRLSDDSLLLEGRPGAHASEYLLGGQRDATGIAAQVNRRWGLYKSGFLLEIALALLAAVAGAAYVTRPLRELRAAMRGIETGDYQVRLDESRRDEFGGLARAFNGMARGLQEGKVLGTYVSTSLRRALEDREFREQAQRGRVANFTILFSGVAFFDEIRETRPAREVFGLMERHLQVVQAALRVHGGEIDKVIGEKILVIFEHEAMGGGTIAAHAALEAAREISRNLRAQTGQEAAIGLNSGSAVAGFVGASTDRQDYTVIGDSVNLAARLATLAHTTSGTRVVLSGNTRGFLGRDLPVEKLPFRSVKGKTRQVSAYLLLET